MRIVLAVVCVIMGMSAAALDEVWRVDTHSASRGFPLVTDYDGSAPFEVLGTTRYDGSVWVLRSDGSVINTLRRSHWIGGSVAGVMRSGKGPLLAFQQSNGPLSLFDTAQGVLIGTELRGEPQLGTSPVFIDLDESGDPEVVCSYRNGTLTAVSSAGVPLWQFDAGAPIDSMPVGAAIFRGQGAVYTLSRDGRLHGLSGQGRPLWFFEMTRSAPAFPSLCDPLIVQLAFTHPSVLVSDAEGWLYAVNSVSGEEEWRVEAGRSALGSPAVLDAHPHGGREIVTVSETGEIAVIDATGSLLSQAALPRGRYVPRPLVADVDGDGALEIVVPNKDWQLVVASLDGAVKETLALQGNVREGAVLADLQGDGTLELLAGTDCARFYCFATRAKEGWTHPRGDSSLGGCVPPIPSTVSPSPARLVRGADPDSVVLPDFTRESPYATAWIHFDSQRKAASASVVIRQGEIVLGSATQRLRSAGLTVPFIRFNSDAITLDIYLYDVHGKAIASTEGFTVRPRVSQPVPLTPPEPLFRALDERSSEFRLPEAWRLPQVDGRDSWHVARYMPEEWRKYGLADEPFIAEAVPRIMTSARDAASLFQPGHPAWEAISKDTKPFFVLNDYFQPEAPYPAAAVKAVRAMAGARFLGFPVHEWAYRVWKARWEGGQRPPASSSEAMAILQADFARLRTMCHGQIYEGEGYCLFHHQAFRWGAPMGYAEVGENVPCAPLQFAFLRGASRQYGGRPWGAYVSNWFRGAVADTRLGADTPAVTWSKPDVATGPDCGHSASLEFRLEMAAHLAGATFVHHESDGHHGSIFMRESAAGVYEISEFGRALRTWYQYARSHTERGTPFTPMAFVVPFDHGWRPREDRFGLWPRDRADLSMENIFKHVFPYEEGLDFERGYLCSGPYGDVFDVLTSDASLDALRSYPIVWPLGRLHPTPDLARALQDYVRQGGVLVLDTAMADAFPADFVGARFKDRYAYGTQIQTALDETPPFAAPFRYQPMWVLRGSEVLAHADDGSPLTVWRREGKGIVITSGTHHWADESDRMLPLVPALLKPLVRAFVPVRLEGDAQMLVSRTPSGWVVGLINNNGVSKVPTQPAEADPAAAQECMLRFTGMLPQRFNSRMGDFRWNARADGLVTRLQPGEVAVVEIVLRDGTPS